MDDRPKKPSVIASYLEKAPGPVFVAYAMFVAFCTYFCMYAFRKPFSAARFAGGDFLGTAIQLKTAIVISQIIGYAISKYIGIKVCSEITPARRAWMLIFLILWAEAALLLFGLVPDQFKPLAILLNGLPLGMVWGLVVWYLEGRRTSEVLLMGLSCSYIVSSGIVKDFGRGLMEGTAASWWNAVPLVGPMIGGAIGHVSEGWMPFVAGLHFLPLFFLSVWLLNQLPQPSKADVAARAGRAPMTGAHRMAFIRQFVLGLVLLCVAYFFLTAYRDFRDNYQVEILDRLGYSYQSHKAVISQTETLVALGVMFALALLTLVKDNRTGFLTALGIMLGGVLLIGVSTLLFDYGMISGFWWMTLTGLGSYLCYVPYGSVLFDRLMASTRAVGTAVFAIYLADAIGYTGSVGVQLYKDLFQNNMSRLGFFRGYSYAMSALGVLCLGAAMIYFFRKSQPLPPATEDSGIPDADAVPRLKQS